MGQKIWTADDLKSLGLADEPEVHSITSADTAKSVDVDLRFKSYFIKMMLRVICVIAALFTQGWVQLACILAAGILPWVAVVAANGINRQPRADFSSMLPPEQAKMLQAAASPSQPQDTEADEEPFIIEGEIITDEEEHGHSGQPDPAPPTQ